VLPENKVSGSEKIQPITPSGRIIMERTESSEPRAITSREIERATVEYREIVAPKTISLEKPKEMEITPLEVLKFVDWYTVSDVPEIFRQYFLSRFRRLREIIRKNISGSLVDISSLTEGRHHDTYIAVIVDSKNEAKSGKGGIIIGEDESQRVRIYLPFDRYPDLREKFNHIISDCVVAARVENVRGNKFIIAGDIIFPDLPKLRERHKARRPLKILIAGDIHIGSKAFMREKFESLIRFLQGKTENQRLNALAEEIEYILLVGDLVDGVGVYPQQEGELEIVDQRKQYEVLARYLSQIPPEKTIVCIPGNHDASTRLIPQPPISREVAEALYRLPNIKILSNPATIEIDNVTILMYHGQGYERIAGILGIPIEKPDRIIAELLRYRHLCPEWGATPQAPLEEDKLVIEQPPDIVISGHIHIQSIGRYKGTAIITPGAFEGITAWQKDIGIHPTVGYFHIIDIHTYQIITLQATETQIIPIRSQRI